MSVSGYHVAPQRVEIELTEDESEWTDGVYDESPTTPSRGGSRKGEESAVEGFFSDDTGFYSAPEPEDMETGGEEEEVYENQGEEDNDVRANKLRVERHYETLVRKYTDQNWCSQVKDPFSEEVDWGEMHIVLEISGERSGLVVAAQLLDIALQLFSKQVRLWEQSVYKTMEELNRLNRRKQGKKGDNSRQADAMQNIQNNLSYDDEGYHSQPHSQQSLLEEEEMDEDTHASRVSRPLGIKRSKKYIAANEEQLINDFVKERSAYIVARRVNLHEHFHQMIQNPYLDHQFNLFEYYEEAGEMCVDSRELDEPAVDTFRWLRRHSNIQCMYLPSPSFLFDEEERGEGEENDVPMEVECYDPGRNGIGDLSGNSENIKPSTNVSQENGNETLNSLTTEIVAANVENILQADMVEGGGENVDPKGQRKKKKRRRKPLVENQNIVPSDDDPESKRPRLEAPATAEGIDHQEVTEHLRQQSPQDQNLNAIGIDPLLIIDDNLIPHPHSFDDGTCGIDMDHFRGDDGDLTSASCEGSFRPPSPLSKQEASQINFQTRTTRVNMKAIKSKFNEIVQESHSQTQNSSTFSEITFVEILRKAEMDIIVGPNETIPSSSFCNTDSSTAHNTCPTSKTEVSVGIAFLAMLHNASYGNFFLVEDTEGAFKVTKERPKDPPDLQYFGNEES